jgi:putative ABC transport system permease protein
MGAEIALSLVLLIGAGLLIRSFVLLAAVDLGFQPERVLAMNINLPETHYSTAERRLAFFEGLAECVSTVPGVQSVAFANRLPMRGGWGSGVEVDAADGGRKGESDFQAVSPGYFQTLAIALLQGRLLTPSDREGAALVAVVNTAFVRRFLPNQAAVGRHLRRGARAPWLTIEGVVGDIRRGGKASPVTPQVYLAAAQTSVYPVRLADFAVRTAGDPHTLVTAIQKQVWAIDKDQPVTNVRTFDEIISRSMAERRFQMSLLALFAGLALLLAMVGIYGVVAYSVSQRTAEIGVRIALGARQRDILGMVIRQALVVVAAGVAAGAAGAYWLSRYLATLLYEIRPTDPATYAVLAVLLTSVALLACYVPARRAMRIDPMKALRWE